MEKNGKNIYVRYISKCIKYIFSKSCIPHENEICMRHIQLFGMKIYFEGVGIIYVKYNLANISQKIYAKYIPIMQLCENIFHIF